MRWRSGASAARRPGRDSVPTKSDTSAAMAASWSFEISQCREFGTAFGDRQWQLRATNQQRDKPGLRQSEGGGLRGQGCGVRGGQTHAQLDRAANISARLRARQHCGSVFWQRSDQGLTRKERERHAARSSCRPRRVTDAAQVDRHAITRTQLP